MIRCYFYQCCVAGVQGSTDGEGKHISVKFLVDTCNRDLRTVKTWTSAERTWQGGRRLIKVHEFITFDTTLQLCADALTLINKLLF